MNYEQEITRLRQDLARLSRNQSGIDPQPGITHIRQDFHITGDFSKDLGGVEYNAYAFVPLTSRLTSTSWDGDAYSTTAKTLINLNSVFGVPAGVRAVLASVFLRDSGSAANACWLILSPNDTANEGVYWACSGLTNDAYARGSYVVPCNADGNVYYQINASGKGTMDVWIQIWGYYL